MELPVIAGVVATVIFASSSLPMLFKARRSRDLRSYSLGNIALANLGNTVQSVYVLHLPPGPIWALHGFYVVSTGLMLFWYLRYTEVPILRGRRTLHSSPEAADTAGSLASAS